MKILCLMLCVVIAVLSGLVMFTTQTVQAMSSTAEAAVLAEEGVQESAEKQEAQASLPMANVQVGLIDELVESLQVAHVDLNSAQLRLDKREKNLQELYATYLKLRQEVNGLLDDLDSRMVKVEQGELKNFKKLSGVYAQMDPASSAQALKHMESERVALILSQMDSRSMASIMTEAVSSSSDGSEHVAEWSDALRRLNEEKDGV